jgi:hypothetical protein
MYELTDCTAVPGGNPPASMPQGYLITTVAWFGYDAVVSGDDVVVSVHEMTYDSYEYYWTAGWRGGPTGGGMIFGANTSSAGTAPILLPGMTGTVGAPDSSHRSQLRLCVLD